MHIMKHISKLNKQYNTQYKCTSKVDKHRHKQSVGYIKYVFTKWLRVDEQVIKWHLQNSNGAITGNFASSNGLVLRDTKSMQKILCYKIPNLHTQFCKC